MLSLRLLGPPELYLGGRPIPLTVRKTWALIVLLATGGRVPRTRLAAQLWPLLDEPTSRRNLRRELARLREAGAEGLLRAEGDALALHEGVEFDALVFKAAVHAGEHARALALWRGPLAEGLTLDDAPDFDLHLQVQRESLRGLWRSVLQALAESAPQQQALGHWQALLADDPLREQHHVALMRLHAAAGHPEAALAQYTLCKTLLREELGLEPMAATAALAAELRASQAGVPPPAGTATAAPAVRRPAPREQLLPPELPFVGRVDEVAALEAAWLAGRPVVIEGEGGVGKTRLALDFVSTRGPCALARCRSGDRDVPYAAWTRILRALAGPYPTRAALAPVPDWACDELARLLPEFRGAAGAAPAIRSDEDRNRFFEACALGWRALTEGSFDAVLLDDWHLADAASRTLLAFVVQRRIDGHGVGRPGGSAATGGAREIVLLRPELDPAAAAALQSLCESTQALHLRLLPLPPPVVLDLLRRLSGVPEPTRFAARLQAATAGNPFFLAETLRHLMEQQLLLADGRGVWQTPFDDATRDYRELPMPASVLDAVLGRVRRLPAASQRVLEAAALAGEPFSPALLAPACALSELDAVLAIEAAVAAQLLREHEAGGFAFVHDLVQQALDAALPAERRRLVHRRLALGAEAAGAGAARIAAHHEASGDAPRAVLHRIAAGDEAQRLHAQAEAMVQWRQGLADGPTTEQALALHTRLLRTQRRLAQDGTRDVHSSALLALVDSGSVTGAARIDTLTEVANHFARNELTQECFDLLDALPSDLSDHQRARAMEVRAEALRKVGRLGEALLATRAALALPGMQGQERANLLFTQALAEHALDHIDTALRLVDEAIALCTQLGDDAGIGRGHVMRGTFLIETGELAAAQAALESAVAHCKRCGSVIMQRGALYSLSALHLARAHPGQALAMAWQGWNIEPPLVPGVMRLMYRSAFIGAQMAVGDLGAAWAHAVPAAQEALAMNEPYPVAEIALVSLELAALLGAVEQGAVLVAAVGDDTLRALPHVANETWLARAQYELMTGDVPQAARTLSLAPAAGQLADPRVRERHGQVSAELALAQGDAASALTLLPAAAAPSFNAEMQLRRLALVVRAQTRLGGVSAPVRALCDEALARPEAHAVGALYLLRALGAADEPCRAHARRLGASLAAHPAQQAAFLRAWG